MKKRLNDGGLLIFTSGTTHYTLTLPSIEVVVNRDDDYRNLLMQAGFSDIQIYNDYDMRDYSKGSKRLIAVAKL